MNQLNSYTVEQAVYKLVKSSTLATDISGGVYFDGDRPHQSQKEDIIIKFIAGRGEQEQKGIVLIRIFVPDIDLHRKGIFTPNRPRIRELIDKAATFYNALNTQNSPFLWALTDTICCVGGKLRNETI